jgi:DnaJ-class molecular chaperone
MPKITVCHECNGKGKVKAQPPAGAAQDATFFLRCRTCNGTGWVITPEEGEAEYARGEAVNVYKELEEIESNPFTREDVILHLKLIIRLLDERLPKPKTSRKESTTKKPKSKK